VTPSAPADCLLRNGYFSCVEIGTSHVVTSATKKFPYKPALVFFRIATCGSCEVGAAPQHDGPAARGHNRPASTIARTGRRAANAAQPPCRTAAAGAAARPPDRRDRGATESVCGHPRRGIVSEASPRRGHTSDRGTGLVTPALAAKLAPTAYACLAGIHVLTTVKTNVAAGTMPGHDDGGPDITAPRITSRAPPSGFGNRSGPAGGLAGCTIAGRMRPAHFGMRLGQHRS
jgi:hypothetical protein